jgi:hypothetical protein
VLVEFRFEASGATGADDGVVEGGRHLAWPDLEPLVPQP